MMQLEMTLTDDDKDRDYRVTVTFRCLDVERGASPRYCCEIENVSLESCTVWLAKCGMDVEIDTNHLRFWERHLEVEFQDEIVERCIEYFESRKFEAA